MYSYMEGTIIAIAKRVWATGHVPDTNLILLAMSQMQTKSYFMMAVELLISGNNFFDAILFFLSCVGCRFFVLQLGICSWI